ncbi:HNH endonuclease (plasmid) [Azospirillum thermophilum]|uniref:HNH endonuclease n=2 Tax=Azospirillum thermophilum TaxID=2202148 RepID=A0A2S2CW18_9PROT|nr:HNH endonuclease [Azospirillum thermophilum]
MPLGWLLAVLAVLGALALAERLDLLPAGTLDGLPGIKETSRTARHAPPPRPLPHTGQAIDYARLQSVLDGIRVEPERSRGYQREDWPHWLASDKSCLNTREQVLIRDSTVPARLSANGCGVLAGRWLDPYTGETFTDPKEVDVDHRVPLQEAHNSGGFEWSRERRAAFANDLTDPQTLVAVSREANRAKGSKGPEEWLPPKRDEICPYVASWIGVKARWGLTMDERERVTVGNILAECRSLAR